MAEPGHRVKRCARIVQLNSHSYRQAAPVHSALHCLLVNIVQLNTTRWVIAASQALLACTSCAWVIIGFYRLRKFPHRACRRTPSQRNVTSKVRCDKSNARLLQHFYVKFPFWCSASALLRVKPAQSTSSFCSASFCAGVSGVRHPVCHCAPCRLHQQHPALELQNKHDGWSFEQSWCTIVRRRLPAAAGEPRS